MKKLIVAAAGLMLAGAMASTASADNVGTSFSSDARARGLFRQDYVPLTIPSFAGDESDTSQWQSRVRLKLRSESKGGAYAVSRIRLADDTWDGARNQGRDTAQGRNIYTDYAYVGTPMGPVNVEAGLLPFNITHFSVYDIRVQGLQIKYATDMTAVSAFYHKHDEFENDSTGAILATDVVDDDDIDRYGVLLDQKFEGGWGLIGSIWTLVDNQSTGGDDGFAATAEVKGAVGTVGLEFGAAFYEADFAGTSDDNIGAYGQAAVPFGAVTLAGIVGMTQDGFRADGDFGPFIMMSDVSNIATGIAIGRDGDTLFAGFVPSVKVSEDLTLIGVLGYFDIDNDTFDSALEASAKAIYRVVDGATLTGEFGYLDFDGAEEPAIGAGVSLDLAF
jgi:hypothetical protein